MRLRQRNRQVLRLSAKQVLITASFGFLFAVFIKLTLLHQFATTRSARASSGTVSVPAGSFIINMGIVPQTYANGMKPYGLVYTLIQDHHIPVLWAIEPSKAKDGVDFTYNGTDYKGGAFIIPSGYIDGAIQAVIASWQSQGVVGVYTTGGVSVPIYDTLTYFPKVMIDNLAGLEDIIINYFDNAGIPSSAYSIGSPFGLNVCYDVWANPHGDPNWSDYRFLYSFVTGQQGCIWAQCHSVSMMEGVGGTDTTGGGGTYRRLNYLATDGLQCYGGKAGTTNCDTTTGEIHSKQATMPFAYNLAGDPVMQFMGTMDPATLDGSEQWYVPQSTGAWRSTVKKLVTSSDGSGGNQGVLMAYGYAFDNANNGLVMYTGGHDLDVAGNGSGTVPYKVAAQRSFLNYLLVTGMNKGPRVMEYTVPTSFNQFHGQTLQVRTESDTNNLAFQWSSTLVGTFSNPTGPTTTFTPGNYASDTTGVITVTVTDACNRINFVAIPYQYIISPLPVTLGHFGAAVDGDRVNLDWMTMSEVNNDYFTVERSADGIAFMEIGRVDGAGTTSTATKYRYTDDHPLEGISFYRLKQTDYDGRTECFGKARVEMGSGTARAASLKTYPNPFVQSLSAQFTAEERQPVTLSVVSLDGKTVYREEQMAVEGLNLAHLDLPLSVRPGIYMLQITGERSMLASGRIMKKYN